MMKLKELLEDLQYLYDTFGDIEVCMDENETIYGVYERDGKVTIF